MLDVRCLLPMSFAHYPFIAGPKEAPASAGLRAGSALPDPTDSSRRSLGEGGSAVKLISDQCDFIRDVVSTNFIVVDADFSVRV